MRLGEGERSPFIGGTRGEGNGAFGALEGGCEDIAGGSFELNGTLLGAGGACETFESGDGGAEGDGWCGGGNGVEGEGDALDVGVHPARADVEDIGADGSVTES